MKKRFTKALAAFLCAVMVLSNNGLSTFADSLHSDVTGNDIAVYEENVSEVSGGEDIIVPSDDEIAEAEEIIEDEEIIEEEEYATFTDEFGEEHIYSLTASKNNIYDISGGELLSVTDEDGNALKGVVVIPENKGINKIGTNAFKGNEDITYVVLPEGTEIIADSAFSGCTKLRGASVPKGVIDIGSNAFAGDPSLIQLSIPKTVERIGNGAFKNCTKLYVVAMDDVDFSSLKYIEADAFRSCAALTYFCSDSTISFPAGLEEIGTYAFAGCESLSKLPLSDSIVSIGEGAFMECTKAASVNIPKDLKVIEKATFKGCTSLATVSMGGSALERIKEEAFSDCEMLGTLTFPFTLKELGTGAFEGCTNLVSAFIYSSPTFDGTVFPTKGKIYLYSFGGGSVQNYTIGKTNIIFVILNDSDSNKYVVKTNWEGQGTIKITDIEGKEIKGGVTADTVLYVVATPANGWTLSSGSLKMNGKSLKLSGDKYKFEMPKGGASVTAKFVQSNQDDWINGTLRVEFSEGEVDPDFPDVVTIKIGQKTKIIVSDDKGVVPARKIQGYEFVNDKTIKEDNNTDPKDKEKYKKSEEIISVSNSGMITAKAVGTAKLNIKYKDKKSEAKTKQIRIYVKDAKVSNLKLKADSYDDVTFTLSEVSDMNVLSANVVDVKKKDSFKIKLKAVAYDAADDSISVPLKWSTSDATIAKLSATETKEGNMTNTITVPGSAKGEAIVTVTATVSKSKTISRRFKISVQDYTPKVISTVTVNPNKEPMGIIKLSPSYGAVPENPDTLALTDSSDFNIRYFGTEGGNYLYGVTARDNIKEKEYSLSFKEFSVIKDSVPYTVSSSGARVKVKFKVKSSKPSPKISFLSGSKIDTLYKHDGTEVKFKVTSIGSNEITSYALAALSTKADDQKFLDNFEIDNEGVITQKSAELVKTSKGKYAVTGYLVLKFAGYDSDVTVKKKITIPTKTTATAYKLNSTKGTFSDLAVEQEVFLDVLDTNNKNKAIDLSDTTNGEYRIGVVSGPLTSDKVEIEDGKIKLTIPSNAESKVKLKLTNTAWNADKSVSLTYEIKRSAKDPKISLSSKNVTVNKLYPEEEQSFTLKSDQFDTDLESEQIFTAKSNSKNAAEYAKLKVEYDETEGEGTVKILDPSIKKGDYKFTCNVKRREKNGNPHTTNTVTLTVKVVDTKPSFTLGSKSVSVNRRIFSVSGAEYDYYDTASISYKVSKLDDGYTLDEEKTLASLACTTKNKADFANALDIGFTDKKVEINLNSEANNGTYAMSFTPAFTKGSNTVYAAKASFKISVYSNKVSVSLKKEGKIDLLKRVDADAAVAAYEATPSKLLYNKSNSMVYTPTVKNLHDKVVAVKIFDSGKVPADPDAVDAAESTRFNAVLLGNKIYVSPKPGVNFKSDTEYKFVLYYTLELYKGATYKGVLSGVQTVKTTQSLPKIKEDKSTYSLYLSNRNRTASFTVKPESYAIESVYFNSKDTNAKNTFEISSTMNSDGSLTVTLRLKDSISYATNSTNNIDFYVKFAGEGTNTKDVKITRSIKINR